MADKSLRSVIAHIADLTRNIYTGDYPVDVKEIVQALNGRCIGIDAPSNGYDEFFDTRLNIFPRSNPDDFSFEIEYAKWKPEPTMRFSIASELGHVLMHTRIERIHEAHWDCTFSCVKDREANEFAACLLMPENLVRSICEKNTDEKGNIQTFEVANYFGTTIKATEMRCKILGLL